jgi:DNA helicase-4
MEIRRSLLLRLVPEAGEEIQQEIDKARKYAKRDRRPPGDVDAEAVEAVAEKFAGRLPHVMTFHALAYAIVHPQGQILFDGQDSDSLGLSRAVQDVIDAFMQRPATRDRIQELMMDHFREDWDKIVAGGFNLGMEDMLALKRSLPRETLGGELVKSRGEKAIADFLFEHDIPYKYERNHWWSGVNYKPDFTIFTEEKAGVIIEYFGMAGDEKYDRLTAEKQEYWAAKKGWYLVSLFPRDLADEGGFEKRLASELEGRGVHCRRLSEEEIWARVRHRAVDRFTRAATSFIGRCRKKSWSMEDLAKQAISHEAMTAAESKFLSLASEIFASYLERLAHCGDDDFDGLMQKAAEAIAAGSTAFLRKSGGGNVKSLRFVCIDEFQDFSELFQRLISAMRKANGSMEFFCVGDDWQAINGFAGSELRFFQRFPDYFDDSSKLHISTNYRSARQIVEIGNDLMMGLGTPAKASKQEAGDTWLCDLSEFQPTLIEKQRHPGDLITPLAARLAHRFASKGRKVVFLARRNGIPWYFNTGDDRSAGRYLDDFLRRVRSCLPEDLRGMVSISTAHKYKGLEKPVVVVLDAVARSYPLIHPDWPFFRIFGDSPLSLAQDDRRLFYVALTRAVESLVVITDSGAQSPFLDEIRSRRTISPLPWKSFPPVAEGGNQRLLVKIKDAAGREYGTQTGTFPIRDLLHACKYQYHGVAKRWERSIDQGQFNLASIQAEPWAGAATDVEANFYDESETLLASYLINRGKWSVEVDNWDLMKMPPSSE